MAFTADLLHHVSTALDYATVDYHSGAGRIMAGGIDAFVPACAPSEQLDKFREGGLSLNFRGPSQPVAPVPCVAHELADFLRSTMRGHFYLHEPLRKSGEVDEREEPFLLRGDTLFHVLDVRKEDEFAWQIAATTLSWHFLLFESERELTRHESSDTLFEASRRIVFGAHDGEGYLIWHE